MLALVLALMLLWTIPGAAQEASAPDPCTPANLVRLLEGLLDQVHGEWSSLALDYGGTGAITIPDTRPAAQRLREEAAAAEQRAARLRAQAEAVEREKQLREEAQQAVKQCKEAR
jgi:hypothetical protein